MNRFSALYKRILILVVSILIFVLLGALALMYSEEMRFLDAVWYSIMTLTTVGFGVPDNFSDLGKIITIFLMLFGVGAVLVWFNSPCIRIFLTEISPKNTNKISSNAI